jgi:type I restriction enzyme S subunit
VTLPAGWKCARLGEECSIEIGGTPSRNTPAYWDETRETTNLWVSIRDMSQRSIWSTAEQLTDAGVAHSNVKLQRPGTILLSFKLTIGRVAVAARPLYTNEAIAGLSSRSIVHDYLYYGLQEWDLLQGVDQAIKGATLNKEKLKRIQFDFAESVPEQTKIAAVLTTVDQAIEHSERLIAKQLRIKTGLMQDLLTCGLDENGELRDPERRPEQFEDTPLGRFPTAWGTPTVNDLAVHVGSGITPTGGSNVYRHKGVLFIRSQNVTFDGLLLDDVAYIDERTHQLMARSKIFAHDVLLNITGASIGRCCPMPEGLGPANVNQHVCAIRTGKARREDAVVLAAMLSSFIGQRQIDRLNAGSNREGLNYQQLRSFLIPWPKQDDERTAMAERIESVNASLRAEGIYLSKLEVIKKGLMQDLLTGRKRVTRLLEIDLVPAQVA